MELAAAYPAHVAHLNEAYSRAAQAAGLDAIVLHAGAPALIDRFDDQHHPLRPTPAFAHWVPIAEPDAVVVVRPGAKPALVRPVVDDFWEAAPATPPEWVLAPFAGGDLP